VRVLVVTIDTEEEGRWSSSYPADGHTCENILRLDRVQRIFEKLGVIPTYLVDHPVVVDQRAREVIRDYARRGRAEIGAHLHPWCNPPFSAVHARTPDPTYPHLLPTELQLEKLEVLCSRIGDLTGARPTSYRAGRWGFDHTSIPALERVGIRIDTSVTPLWWDPAPGGPSFARASSEPYWLDPRDATRPGRSHVLEIPMGGVVVGPIGRVVESGIRWIGPFPGGRSLLVRLGARFLRPELYDERQMRQAADCMAERGLEVFNVMFHSSAVLPAATPYVRDESDLTRFCDRLEGILRHVVERHGARPLPLSSVPPVLSRIRGESAAA